jgi:HlyD family secretion protein
MRRRARVTIGVVTTLVIAATAGIIAATRRGAVTEVRVEVVGRRDLESVVSASGWVRPHRKVDVQADIMGRITELHVREGQPVTRGQILLRIDPAQYEQALARAKAALSEAQARAAQARANKLQAQRNHERLLGLFRAGENLVSPQQVEEAATQLAVQQELYRAAEFGVEQARAAVGEAEDRLSKTVIRAPMDGIITRLNVDEGETAIVGTMNNPGSLLLTVADLSTMEAVVRVDETDVPRLSLGDSTVLLIDAFPRRTFVGRVTEISHSSVRPPGQAAGTGQQNQAIDFEVVITIADPPPGLRPDLSATADIVVDRRPGALAIPIIALTVRDRGAVEVLPQEDPAIARAAAEAAGAGRRNNDVEGVFAIRDGTARFVAVEVGVAGREHFEVVSGLVEGDSIVAGPYEAIRGLEDGRRVRPMTQDGARRGGAARTAGS